MHVKGKRNMHVFCITDKKKKDENQIGKKIQLCASRSVVRGKQEFLTFREKKEKETKQGKQRRKSYTNKEALKNLHFLLV